MVQRTLDVLCTAGPGDAVQPDELIAQIETDKVRTLWVWMHAWHGSHDLLMRREHRKRGIPTGGTVCANVG